MQPIRTPLKTELGLSAAKARGGRTRLAAAADMLPRKARLEVKLLVFMVEWDWGCHGSLEEARSACKICRSRSSASRLSAIGYFVSKNPLATVAWIISCIRYSFCAACAVIC